MPLLPTPDFAPPPYLRSPHLQTILPTIFRKVASAPHKRERIRLPDGDFLDLDWRASGAPRLAILSHGLEGNSQRSYILGMARALQARGWDTLAWNHRGCSGSPNDAPRLYHSGATEDLDAVVRHALVSHGADTIALLGFSLGGNMTLKYLGERGDAVPGRVRAGVVFSTPCDLTGCAGELARWQNTIYMQYFLKSLRQKIRTKAQQFPVEFPSDRLWAIHDLKGFDDRYTAPLHGFRDADDYWTQSSARRFVSDIRRPTLLVNALDDPFLTPTCSPVAVAKKNEHFHLQVPLFGGHVGFMSFDDEYWSERRAATFLDEVLS